MKKIFRELILLAMALFALVSCGNDDMSEPLIPVSQKALSDTTSLYYADFASYPSEQQLLPIGVFDSGTGGLTVLETLLSVDLFDNITGKETPDGIPDFAGENFVYLADYANMPYGEYRICGREDYLRELVVKDALFLMGKNYYNLPVDDIPTGVKSPVKLIVMACNTANACGFKDVDTLLTLSGTSVKVVGVMDAGVEATLEVLDKQKDCAIGVLSTPGSLSAAEFDKIIRESASKKGFYRTFQIFNQDGNGISQSVDGIREYVSQNAGTVREDYKGPCLGDGEYDIDINLFDRYNFDFSGNSMLFTKERGKYVEVQLNSPSNYARFHLVSLVEKHRRSGSRIPLSCIILGSTHYPYVLDTLNKVLDELYNFRRDGMYLYRNSISKDCQFINPAQHTAKECYKILRESHKLALKTVKSELNSFISIPAYKIPPSCLGEDGQFTSEFKYGREVGTEEINTKIVPFSQRYVGQETVLRMEQQVPISFSLIKKYLY